MALFRTSNPALNDNAFRSVSSSLATGETMTLPGTVNKTGILLLCTAATAAWSWNQLRAGDLATLMPLVLVGAIGGFIVAMVTIFKKSWAPVTAPVYALLEGLVLGTVSAALEVRYPGIAIQAV